ncbi:hypothetical protein C900_00758 [Fulvivirga imtechensis AK7]|uniref:Uncharacterized protein n=1 Tax=Fulvivirga imtechensis AK7 TaxID=1237149 RepID=L8K011_9BACT|nr:hypothetical protein [Fulvivirga imtechensis]ELR72797.1 hypothetical protein C900_00758 [Fulvivirga imtechensis AK7]
MKARKEREAQIVVEVQDFWWVRWRRHIENYLLITSSRGPDPWI